jgi:outer membrane protein OmpA-like peptidoglycan-associated protein
MKKQVLSFTEFINEAYSMINEGKTWSDVKTLLSDYLDSDAKSILADIESTFKADARPEANFKGKKSILDIAGEVFGKVVSEKFNGKYTNITDLQYQISDLTYNKVIQGSVYVTKNGPLGGTVSIHAQTPGSFPMETNGMMKLEDVLNGINIKNMVKFSGESVTETDKKYKAEFTNISKSEKKDFPWWFLGMKPGEGRKINNSGSDEQYYITAIDDKIEVQEWSNRNQDVKPVSDVKPVPLQIDRGTKLTATGKGDFNLKREKKDSLKKAGSVQYTYVFYAVDPKSINAGRNKGADKTVNDIKEIKIQKREPDTTEKLTIEDNGVLFTQGGSGLTADGKAHIYNAITQRFTSVSEITIQGSASQEGDRKVNEQLCKDRAKSVQTYLKTVVDGATVTASETAKIQPATPVTDEATRKTFRCVELMVKGTIINPGAAKEETKYVPVSKKIKCDMVTIKEIQMTFTVEIDKAMAQKAGFFKRGVDVDDRKQARTKRSERS